MWSHVTDLLVSRDRPEPRAALLGPPESPPRAPWKCVQNCGTVANFILLALLVARVSHSGSPRVANLPQGSKSARRGAASLKGCTEIPTQGNARRSTWLCDWVSGPPFEASGSPVWELNLDPFLQELKSSKKPKNFPGSVEDRMAENQRFLIFQCKKLGLCRPNSSGKSSALCKAA